MIKNIFLDRDGVINEVIMRWDIVSSPRTLNEFKFKEDFIDSVSELNKFNGNIFIVSNQPDVSRKLLDKSVLEQIDIEIRKQIQPKEIIYCTCDGEQNCDCRKPKPGMINDLIKKYNLIKQECCIVGDSVKDIDAGNFAGIITVYLSTSYNTNQKVLCHHKIYSFKDFFELNLI